MSQKETFENKKAAVLTDKKNKNTRGVLILIAVAVAVVAVLSVILSGGGEQQFDAVAADNGIVRIPVSAVSDGKAHYYTYNGINFFMLKSSDGVIRAAFDACDVCFPAKKGYRQEGDYMVCNNCGQRFASVNINVLKGGCNPAPLERTVEGNTVVVKVSDIETGRKYF